MHLKEVLLKKQSGDRKQSIRELLNKGGCDTPGEKIRSGGKGRGLAIGDGKGPIGVPIEDKKQAIRELLSKNAGSRVMSGPATQQDIDAMKKGTYKQPKKKSLVFGKIGKAPKKDITDKTTAGELKRSELAAN